MNPESWRRVKKIFNEAVALPLENRARFLANASGGDALLRGAVEKLLAADAEQASAANNLDDFSIVAAPAPFVNEIGAYRIVEKIGEGGMGAVYLAERVDLKQRAALKIIRRGAESDAILKRFRREQEILAALEHPNIARLIDVGASADGAPFLAMEYVEGEDLNDFARRRDLSVAEKLRLFRKICEAVAYAHSRLVVHRDLKPSNVVVNRAGEPKLLDFGISKLLDDAADAAAEKGTVTSFGMLTPNYAAPEQFLGETVTTAADVYSLGVILYELLTGVLPYETSGKRPHEAARAVIETNPQKPSEAASLRQSSIVESHSKTASVKSTDEKEGRTTKHKKQKTDPKSKIQNPKFLKGDLDNIVLKALRKEPARRYSSVEKFSEDLRRHLVGLPVSARPDTFSYRAEKFLARNRAAVAAVATVFLLLTASVVGVSWQYVRAERERERAEQRFRQVRELANNVVFKYHDGIANLPGSTEIRRMLVNDATHYLDALAQDARDDPELRRELANAYVKLADVQGKTYYSNTGDTAGAVENYRKAVGILDALAAEQTAPPSANDEKTTDDLIVAYQTLGMMQGRLFQHDAAVKTQRRALDLVAEKAARQPEDVAVQYLLVRANGRYADAVRDNGQFDEALNIYRRTLRFNEDLHRRAPDNENVETALAVLSDRIGKNLTARVVELKAIGAPPAAYETLLAEAETRSDTMFRGFATLAAAHPEKKKYRRDLSTAYANLATIYRETNRLDKSRALLESDAHIRRVFAAADLADRESQADLSEALANLAQTKAAQREFAGAFDDFRRSIEIYDRLIAADAANMEFRALRFETENHFAAAIRQSGGETGRALEIHRRAFERLRQNAAENLYFAFAEGVMYENVGDCYARMPPSRENAEKMRAAYRQTAELWQPTEIRRGYFSRTPEKLDRLARKIADAEALAARAY